MTSPNETTARRDAIRERLDKLRQEHQPLEGELHRFPTEIRKYINHRQLFDHWGQVVDSHGRSCLACEPYPFDDMLPMAEQMARTYRLEWLFSTASWWFPANTVHFRFWPPDGDIAKQNMEAPE